MILNNKISDEKMLYDINKISEVLIAKISALLSSKIEKYEYRTGEEILQQAKITYSSLGKANRYN